MKLQASSIYRVMQCPGSVRVEEEVPSSLRYVPFKSASEFGTKCHDVAEGLLKQEFVICAGPGDVKKFVADQFKNSDDYDRAYNAVNHYVKHYRKVARSSRHKGVTTLYIIEEKFRYLDKTRNLEAVAKADAAIITYKKDGLYMDFFDLKTGNFDYSESATEQIFFGALVYLASSALNLKPDVKIYLNCHVVQPNYWNAPDKVFIKKAEPFTFSDAIDKLLSCFTAPSMATYNPGEHCRFCSGVLVCPALKSRMEYMTAALNASAPVEMLSSAEIETLYLIKPEIELYLKAVEAVALDRVEEGVKFENLQIAYTSGHRRWIDTKIVEEKLSFLGDALYDKKIKSPAQVEKLAGKENISELYMTPQIKKLVAVDNPFDTGKE